LILKKASIYIKIPAMPTEKEYNKLRSEMVRQQLIPRGITDKRVLEAFLKVPRHLFIPEAMRDSAYEDNALPIGHSQTISQPYMVAVMTEKLALKGEEKVLEIGTGSGYQAAILAKLCKKVYSIERVESLSRQAEKIIKELNYSNIEFIIGDGTLGYEKESPYDAIIVTAGCREIPRPLLDQLKDGGRLVIPLGEFFQQILTTVVKKGEKLITEESVPCVFVPLIGEFGWKAS
jgi:protein-L-isoaspartate(D-aspartate) O-methyltransferase